MAAKPSPKKERMTESGSYQLEMFLNKDFTIRDADNLIKDLTKQLKE